MDKYDPLTAAMHGSDDDSHTIRLLCVKVFGYEALPDLAWLSRTLSGTSPALLELLLLRMGSFHSLMYSFSLPPDLISNGILPERAAVPVDCGFPGAASEATPGRE